MAGKVDFKDVLLVFSKYPSTCSILPLGRGNINDTFIVESVEPPFVLQRISRAVFSEPIRVIENFQKVSSHLAGKTGASAEPFIFAVPVLTRHGELYYQDCDGSFWRGQTYIPHSSVKVLSGCHQAGQLGFVLAAFHHFVADLDPQILQDPLPDFHNLQRYLECFDQELTAADHVAEGDMQYCLDRIGRYRTKSLLFEKAISAGVVSLQPIHGDPKIDNFLFNDAGEPFGMLDLDTVRAGLVHHDLGDCLRSCCNLTGEDGIEPVTFDMELCKALLEGYFSWPQSGFSPEQYSLIYDAVLLISFELAIRFVTDHLRGDVYFKVVQMIEN